jgi:hypothetical protein
MLSFSSQSKYDDLSNAETEIQDIETIDMLTMDNLLNICTDFVNDSETIVGMENLWTEYLVREFYVDLDKQSIKNVLNVPCDQDVIQLTVKLYQAPYGNRQWYCDYGDFDIDIYIALNNYGIVISTHKRLLYE